MDDLGLEPGVVCSPHHVGGGMRPPHLYRPLAPGAPHHHSHPDLLGQAISPALFGQFIVCITSNTDGGI